MRPLVLAALLLLVPTCGEEIDDDCDAPEPCRKAAQKFYECCTDQPGGLDWEDKDDRCEGAKRLGASVSIDSCRQWANTDCNLLGAQCGFAPR